MGCRGNIEIIQPKLGHTSGEVSIYLYTHWGGEELCQDLARGLDKGQGRWLDPDYLTRIIFNEMQKDDRGTTGFGISVYPAGDAEFPTPSLFWPTTENRLGYQQPHDLMIQYKEDFYSPDEFIEKFLPAETVSPALQDTQEIPVVS